MRASGVVLRQEQNPYLWSISCSEWRAHELPPIPRCWLALLKGDPDAVLDLQKALQNVYDSLGYDLEIDYRRHPDVPFTKTEAARASAYLRSA
jgi:hypothetical protein